VQIITGNTPSDQCFKDVELMCQEHYGHMDVNLILGYNSPSFDLLPLLEILKKQSHKKLIIYQLEPLILGTKLVRADKLIRILKMADEIWDYDKANINYLKDKYQMTAVYRPLRYAECLKKDFVTTLETPEIDVLFYGALDGAVYHKRRRGILYDLKKSMPDVKFEFISGSYGVDLDSYIAKSRIILNIHSKELMPLEQVRLFYCLINNKLVISEPSPNNIYGDIIKMVSVSWLTTAIHEVLRDQLYLDDTISERFKKLSEGLYANIN
jgi:hypothetical protein